MRVEIYADLVCPWCYVGVRRLKRALASRPSIEPTLAWRPFQLNPSMPRGGIDRSTYLSLKFGGRERIRHVHDMVIDAGQTVGIAFRFDRIARQPSTLDAHRLLRFAGEQSEPSALESLVESLYRAYFIDGLDIGDRETLTALAAENGFIESDVRRYLASDSDLDQIRAEDLRARRLGIDGVPCFVIDERYAISGAQEPEAFQPLFDLATA